MFVQRKIEISYYESNNLFLSFNGPFCPVSHKEILISFAGARWFTTGLFLFPKSDNNGNERQSHLNSGARFRLQYRSGCNRGRSLFFGTCNSGRVVIPNIKRGLDSVKDICRLPYVIMRTYTYKSPAPTSVENRKQDVGPGISIRPKSLLNLLSGRQHYPGGAKADSPSALMLWNYRKCQRGCAFNFFRG